MSAFSFFIMLLQKIKDLSAAYKDEFISIRRHLHAHPELSYQEWETSQYVQDKLTAFGIPFTVIAQTGVVGLIEGRNPKSRTIAIRADMDALPITEENEVAYKSVKPGIMHACGHDVHTTCLLGAAKILKETSGDWEGTIKLIFQPGEEKKPWRSQPDDKRWSAGKSGTTRYCCLARTSRFAIGQAKFPYRNRYGQCR